MQGIVSGRQESLGPLYERYRSFLYGVIVQTLHHPVDAEEALQDTFLSIWKQASHFDASKGKPLGWVGYLARRRAIDHWRKLYRRTEVGVKLLD